jgi:hypothetical protein
MRLTQHFKSPDVVKRWDAHNHHLHLLINTINAPKITAADPTPIRMT